MSDISKINVNGISYDVRDAHTKVINITNAGEYSTLLECIVDNKDTHAFPFSIQKQGNSTSLSDIPITATTEFNCIVTGDATRWDVLLYAYGNPGDYAYVRSGFRTSWLLSSWYTLPFNVPDSWVEYQANNVSTYVSRGWAMCSYNPKIKMALVSFNIVFDTTVPSSSFTALVTGLPIPATTREGLYLHLWTSNGGFLWALLDTSGQLVNQNIPSTGRYMGTLSYPYSSIPS